MPRFTDSFIEEVRAALKPSVVVGRHFKLVRAGDGEFTVSGDKSFTVSDRKGLIFDFGRTGFSGDIFAFEVQQSGCTFVEAVETLARLAGISVPDAKPVRKRGNGAAQAPPPDEDGDPGPEQSEPAPSSGRGKTDSIAASGLDRDHLVATYPYRDADGGLRYEVCRFERFQDGRRVKSIRRRRPSPGEPGVYVWGLEAGEYVRPSWTRDWSLATEERLERWKGKIVARRQVEEGEPPLLYRFPELLEETLQPPADRRTVFCPEGEKDTDTLAAWDLVATTVCGGAKNFEPHHAAFLADCDVVILADNDQAGRKAAYKKAAALRGLASRIRVLDFRHHWAACPEKGDVTDWKELGGGTRDKLMALVDQLPDWTPEPPETTFSAFRFSELDRPARELQWLIKRVITRNEVSIWYGAPGSGKSFLIADAGLAIARGASWFGLRCRQGLVVYQVGATEGGLGARNRLKAYRRFHNIPASEEIPFVTLPTNIDLSKDDADLNRLAEEILAWRDFYDAPLELIIIDTFSAASPGVEENSTREVTPVLARCHKLAAKTGAHVALVHHMPKAGGGPRGTSAFVGNVSTLIEIARTEQTVPGVAESGNAVRRDLRTFTVTKQKDAVDRLSWSFVLRGVTIGLDEDREPIAPPVVEPAGAAAEAAKCPPGWAKLVPAGQTAMRALIEAVAEHGIMPPKGMRISSDVSRVVEIARWREKLVEMMGPPADNDPTGTKLRNQVRSRIVRAYTDAGWADPRRLNLIGRADQYVWRTPRKVWGIDDPDPVYVPPPQRPSSLMDERDFDDGVAF